MDYPGENELRPETEADLAQVVRAAAARRRPLEVIGGGTRGIGHRVSGDPLRLSGLSGITLYEPGALTLVARAGTPLVEVEAALAGQGQRLPFEPWDARALMARGGAPTIGGAVAVNASGPRRLQAGACRDSLIGVRFVDGTGQVVKNGGRVMKNVTGLDLVKLMAGSHGTLGVMTEVAFKVLPAAEATATLVFTGLSDEQAIEAMTAAMGTPFDVTGAAHLSQARRTLIRVEGFPGQVEYRVGRLADALARFGAPERASGGGDWLAVRDAVAFAGRPGDVWRISVRPTEGARVGAALRRLGAAAPVYDWAGGLVWALVPEGGDARAALDGMRGHATLIRASEATKRRLGVFHPDPAPIARINAGLRARFDPGGILNPGRMSGPIRQAA